MPDCMMHAPFEHSVYLSDFHAGRKSGKKKNDALDSVQGVLERTGIQYVGLLGDIADNRPSRKAVASECKRIRQLFRGISGLTVPGNHDDGTYFTDTEIEDLTGYAVSPLVVADSRTGVAVTHGHLFGTRKVKHLLREVQTMSSDDTALLQPVFDAATPAIIRLNRDASRGFLLERILSCVGISACEWHEFYCHTGSTVRQAVAELLRSNQQKKGVRSTVADMIEDHSIASAGQLANLTGSWAAVTGHTHNPSIRRMTVADPLTGSERVCLVGNSGSFVSRHTPTVITTEFPSMTLWQYHAKSDEMRKQSTVCLTEEEAAFYLGTQRPPQVA